MKNFYEGRLKSLELFRKEVDKKRHDKSMKWNYFNIVSLITKSKIHLWKLSDFCQNLKLRQLSAEKKEELGVVDKGFGVGALAKGQIFH